jgi:diketogulonate reductase-like aldo/keto reductase
MERRRFGSTTREVPVIGQGTWYLDRGDRGAAVAALRRGLDLGMAHIDTAEMYGDAEEVIAQAITGRRDEAFLISKVLPEHASLKGTIAACERSLTRLRTDRLDSYLLHWAGRHPLEDTIAAFEQLRRGGKILSWGVSNFDVHELEAARLIAGEGRMACNQVLYHLEERAIEHAVVPWCQTHQGGRGGIQPVRARALSRPPNEGRPRPAGDRRRARCHPASGRASLPGTGPPSSRSPRRAGRTTRLRMREPGISS